MGGVFRRGPLQIGKNWETKLPLSDYLDIRKPGEYTVEILYHDELSIADLNGVDELTNLIYFKSERFSPYTAAVNGVVWCGAFFIIESPQSGSISHLMIGILAGVAGTTVCGGLVGVFVLMLVLLIRKSIATIGNLLERS